MHYHRTSSDDTTLADGNTRTHNDAPTQPCIIANTDGMRDLLRQTSLQVVHGMLRSVQLTIGTYKDMVSNAHISTVQDSTVIIEKRMLTHRDIIAMVAMKDLPSSEQTHRTKPIKTSSNRLLSSKFAASWTRFIELAILLSIVIGVIWLISKIVTPQVVTAVSVIVGFLILRFIIRVILKVTFTLLSILFWLAILCAILLCVL